MENKTVEMPAGLYYIGDPCYVLSREDYNALIEKKYGDEKPPHNTYEIDGRKLAVFDVEEDGGYATNKEGDVLVDSGCIGAVPLSLVVDMEKADFTGFFEEFETPTPCGFVDDRLVFGDLVIEV
jgi:hypothetical protein